jgi:hypothetical protein
VEALMFRSKLCLYGTIVVSMLIGMSIIIGCGSSAEQQKLTGLIQEYSSVLDAYASAVEGADEGKKSELDAKIKDLMTIWSATKLDMIDNITPQVLDELDNKYQELTKKYQELSSHS